MNIFALASDAKTKKTVRKESCLLHRNDDTVNLQNSTTVLLVSATNITLYTVNRVNTITTRTETEVRQACETATTTARSSSAAADKLMPKAASWADEKTVGVA